MSEITALKIAVLLVTAACVVTAVSALAIFHLLHRRDREEAARRDK